MDVAPDEKRFLLEEKYNGIETPEFFLDLNRLSQGEPVAYVIGWVPFLGCTIFLDSHPLIPRPETEYWTEKAIEDIGSPTAPLRVLDLFAGSGAVGVAVLKHIPDAHVDFGEIDTAHLPTIKKNLEKNSLDTSRARVIETDVWSNIPDRYNVVLANPPYLTHARIERVQESVLAHEPERALFAEADGFELIEKTIRGLPTHLLPGGSAYIEHEPEHESLIQGLTADLGMHATTHPDQFGVRRYSKILFPA